MSKGVFPAKPGLSLSRAFVILTISAVCLNGCATVVMSGGAAAVHASADREVLKMAAADVAAVAWPKPQSVSMGERLAGIGGASSEKITKKDAIAAYVGALNTARDPHAALLEDARKQLASADALNEAARDVATAARPSMKDVATVEAAIGFLRQSRDIYLASLTDIIADRETRLASAKLLRADFNAVIREIGAAADVIADRVAADRTQTFAQPKVRSNFF